jgi:23S rRNA (adenine2030-N6)-methyltransferase
VFTPSGIFMLSYRHAFHAGNHADVLKHYVLIQVLQYLALKDKAYWVIDTHAGAGAYALDSQYAEKLQEYRQGIEQLWGRNDLPPGIEAYVAQVRACNPGTSLRFYPGSPMLTQQMLRPQDKLRLFELHTTDFELLHQWAQSKGKQVIAYADDGFARLKALIPPESRRGLVLIDPSYELREDYDRLIDVLQDALIRFPSGTYAIWYPHLPKPESRQLPHQLKALNIKNWLHVTLGVRSPTPGSFGMHGSGMFVINPPWTLAKTLQTEMPWLTAALAEDPGASHTLEYQLE